jgi:hypothetical protein
MLPAGVDELIVTVLETALVTKIPVWLAVAGGAPKDQLLEFCQRPVVDELIQLLGCDAAAASATPKQTSVTQTIPQVNNFGFMALSSTRGWKTLNIRNHILLHQLRRRRQEQNSIPN